MPASQRRASLTFAAAASIAGAIALAYANALHGPFLYDDEGSVLRNPSLRHWTTALMPPSGGWPTSGRPLFNLSLALNFAASGLNTESYHVLSVLVLLVGAWTLLGVVRRTLRRRHYADDRAAMIAWAAALLWGVHPLLTEAATYISQRSEALAGLFYLLTLYAFIRSAETGASVRRWRAVSIAACVLGMASKEVMVTAPVMVLLYDRVFVAGNWRGLRERKGYYAALAATWIELAALMHQAGSRGGTAGFGTAIPAWAYAITQFRGISDYLHLAIWPHPLLFSYGLTLGGPPVEIAIAGALVLGLAVWSLVAAVRGSALGFLGTWFFLILAPTSSIVPIATELIAEHRVYLSLAAVTTLVAWGTEWAWSKSAKTARSPAAAGWAMALVAAAEVFATHARNRAYASVVALWSDTVAKSPDDAGARNNLGNALAETGQLDAAVEQFQAALRLVPGYDDPHFNLANALVKLGRPADAIPHYQAALRVRPRDARIRYGLGSALHQCGDDAGARLEFQLALAGESDSPPVWYDLGNAFLDLNELPEAKSAFAHALRLKPDFADALANYGGVLAQMGDSDGAIAAFGGALRLEPNAADVHNNLGGILAQSGRLAEAERQFQAALAINPDYREARDNLARVQALEAEAHP